MLRGIDNIMQNTPHIRLMHITFYKILSVPHNILMDLNIVMFTAHLKRPITPLINSRNGLVHPLVGCEGGGGGGVDV